MHYYFYINTYRNVPELFYINITSLSHKSWKRQPIEIIDYIACSLEDAEQEKNCELNRGAVYPTIRIISPGSLRMRGDIGISQRETDYYILFYTHSNGDHLRSMLEMTICPRTSTARREILRWVDWVRERKLSTTLVAFSFFPLPLKWIATDDRNNWIVGCLKHAHFKRMNIGRRERTIAKDSI